MGMAKASSMETMEIRTERSHSLNNTKIIRGIMSIGAEPLQIVLLKKRSQHTLGIVKRLPLRQSHTHGLVAWLHLSHVCNTEMVTVDCSQGHRRAQRRECTKEGRTCWTDNSKKVVASVPPVESAANAAASYPNVVCIGYTLETRLYSLESPGTTRQTGGTTITKPNC